MIMPDQASSHTVCILDIANSSAGNARRQRHLDKGLRAVLDEVQTQARFETETWFRRADGDSATLAMPAEVPKAWVASEWTRALEMALRRFNEPLDQLHKLRLRLAIDHGDVVVDGPNISGSAVTTAARLCESQDLRLCLQLTPAANLALIVSERFFDDVVCEREFDLDPADFDRVRVDVKNFQGHGWLKKIRSAPKPGSLTPASAPSPGRDDNGSPSAIVRGNVTGSVIGETINANGGQLGVNIHNYGPQ